MPSRLRVSAFLTTGTIRPLPSSSSTAKPRLTKLLRDDLVAADLAVHVRAVAERLDRRARDEGEVGRVDAVRRLVLLLQLLADRDDLRHVDLDRARDVRRRVERAAHVLGDPAPHRASSARRLAALRPERGCAAPAGAGGSRSGGLRSGAGGAATARAPAAQAPAGGPASMKARMSFFVTRPPRPVPATGVGSMPCSAAIRATTGETNGLPFPDGAGLRRAARGRSRQRAPARLCGCRGSGARAAGSGSGGGRAARRPARRAAPRRRSGRARVPTSTVSPSARGSR